MQGVWHIDYAYVHVCRSDCFGGGTVKHVHTPHIHTHTHIMPRTGFGTLTERDGGCYEGEFHGNRRHGEGSQVYASGNQYKGDWVEGRRHGQGTLKCTDGTVYNVSWYTTLYMYPSNK